MRTGSGYVQNAVTQPINFTKSNRSAERWSDTMSSSRPISMWGQLVVTQKLCDFVEKGRIL